MKMRDIEIKPAHPSLCVWDLYADGEFVDQYESYHAAEEAAEQLTGDTK